MQFLDNDQKRNRPTSKSMERELRTVGQGLESLDVEDFDLRGEDDGYFALAVPQAHDESPTSTVVGSPVLLAWWSLTRRSSADRELSESAPDVLRVLFTPEELIRLDAAGIARRSAGSSRKPDFTKLAQVLRMIGERLDARAGRLRTIRKRGDWISFEYANGDDEQVIEEWQLSDIHRLWLDSSKRRA